MKYLKTISLTFYLALFSFFVAKAQGNESNGVQISIFGNPGISSAYGEYPSEYNSSVDFSFSAGARVRIYQAFNTKMMLNFDVGFLEVAYNGHVAPTDSRFYSSYDFLTINILPGIALGEGYLLGGLYYAKSLGGDQYQEYIDRWISLTQQNDLGLAAEIGKDLGEYITIGVQGRLGIKSIGKSVDIKTWALHGKLGINIFTIDK